MAEAYPGQSPWRLGVALSARAEGMTGICSSVAMERTPDDTTDCSAACDIGLMRPSARLLALRIKPKSEIVLSRKPSRAAEMPSIMRFSDVLKPFKITLKRLFESSVAEQE
eukprot:IDg6184t1